jgi:hypothetical protein
VAREEECHSNGRAGIPAAIRPRPSVRASGIPHAQSEQDATKAPLPPVAGAGQCQASLSARPRLITYAALLRRLVQVERIDLECGRGRGDSPSRTLLPATQGELDWVTLLLVSAMLLTGCASTQQALPVSTGTFWGYTAESSPGEPTLVVTPDQGACESAHDADIKRVPGTPTECRALTLARGSDFWIVPAVNLPAGATGVRAIARDARRSSASSRSRCARRCESSSGRRSIGNYHLAESSSCVLLGRWESARVRDPNSPSAHHLTFTLSDRATDRRACRCVVGSCS